MRASVKERAVPKARSFAIAAAIAVLLPLAAYAQQQGDPYVNNPGVKSDAQKRTEADIDKAYQQTVKQTRDKGPATRADPWGTVRPAASDSTKK